MNGIPTYKNRWLSLRALARGSVRLLILGAASLLLLMPAHASNLSGQGASPNPFSPPVSTNTTISYTLGAAALTWIDIYNAGGTLQRDLLTPGSFTATNKAAGANSSLWDGKNNAAAFVADGVYNYRIQDAWLSATLSPIGTNPHDIAVDPSNPNNMWMLDKAASKYVQKSTNGGTNWTAVTTTGADAKAWGIVISNDGQKIYIADDGQTGLIKSTDAGANWGLTANFPFPANHANDVAIDSTGSIIYVLNGVYATPTIARSANDGTSWSTCAATGISPALGNGVTGLATDSAGTTVIVLDSNTDTVWKSTDSCATFSKLTAITSGTTAGKVSFPNQVAIQSDGSFWISESTNNRIQQFDANGNSLMVIGGTASGSGNYQFTSSNIDLGIGLATISGQPYIFVADFGNNRIQKIGYDNWASSTDITIDTVAPTSTITSGSYDPATDTLTITGTNFTTIDTAGTNIKTYVDWTKFVWDINGDNAVTPNITFAVGDVTSLTITNATTLTLVFTAAKGTAIEATAGYGAAGGADTIDVTAGFIKDQAGNAATTDGVANAPLTIAGTTTTLATGTDPGNSSIAPSGAATNAGAFSFQTSSGTDTITNATVTLAAGTSGGLSLVEITNVAGTTVYGSVTNPASDTPVITLSTNTLTATTTLTEYRIRITPKTHANMPAPAGSTYSVTALISNWTGTNTHAGSDTAGTTVTIDNLSPANVTAATATPGNTQVALAWTNPVDADFHSVVVLRRTGGVVADTPVEGTTYVVTNTIGASTVVCVVASPGTSCNDTGLTNGTAYYYKIFAKDSNGNYSATGVVPTGSPATPVAPATPSLTFLKTVAVTSDPYNNTTNPKNIPGAEVLYTLRVTNSGTGTVDNNTLIITDPIPANTELFTGNLSGGAPFIFTDGTPTSGLSCAFTALNNFADCMDFSNDSGASWTYVPNGSFDSAVTNIRFSLSGTMNGTGGGNPYFDLNFRVRVK